MSLTPLDETSIEVLNVPKGKILFRQGDAGDAAYVVNAGAVGIYREVDGRKVPLATVRRGELFGEMAVIDGSPRMATAFTLEDSTLMRISVDTISDKMRKADPFVKALIHMLMNNLRSVHDSYTPKARTLLDSVNTLQRQSDMVAKVPTDRMPAELKAALAAKLAALETVVKDLRTLAAAMRELERRDNAIPHDGDLP
ncbi:MAG: cyclic nucleotide-binding domain-containing protein [Rhodospirillaceae bacterium]|nr:cyclic nucleotide-binding domain-containing protein [Rhodospirillaceae bacterium]